MKTDPSDEQMRDLGRGIAKVQDLYHQGYLDKQEALRAVDQVIDHWLEETQ